MCLMRSNAQDYYMYQPSHKDVKVFTYKTQVAEHLWVKRLPVNAQTIRFQAKQSNTETSQLFKHKQHKIYSCSTQN